MCVLFLIIIKNHAIRKWKYIYYVCNGESKQKSTFISSHVVVLLFNLVQFMYFEKFILKAKIDICSNQKHVQMLVCMNT